MVAAVLVGAVARMAGEKRTVTGLHDVVRVPSMIGVQAAATLKRKRRQLAARVLGVAAAGAALIVAVTVIAPASPSRAYRAAGRPLPLPAEQLADVTPATFGGILVGLRGTPVVVNVWASWCPPCRAEMPLLQRAAARYRGRVVFLGVASKDAKGAAAKFLDKVDVTYPNVFDASGEVRAQLGLRGFPTTYLFDASGELRDAVVGGITEPRLAAQLADLLR